VLNINCVLGSPCMGSRALDSVALSERKMFHCPPFAFQYVVQSLFGALLDAQNPLSRIAGCKCHCRNIQPLRLVLVREARAHVEGQVEGRRTMQQSQPQASQRGKFCWQTRPNRPFLPRRQIDILTPKGGQLLSEKTTRL
jgi:hypothetical protein